MPTIRAQHPGRASIRAPMPPAEPAGVALAGSDRPAYEKAGAVPTGRLAGEP
jgi:hypothetical protein